MNSYSKSDLLFHTLQSHILSGAFAPGNLLLEQKIADDFQISRLTARETLKRLCQEGYLKSFPRKGYLVTGITPQECQKIQCIRFQLESYAIRLALNAPSDSFSDLEKILNTPASDEDPYQTINFRFHMGLACLSQNSYLESTLKPLLFDVCRYAITSTDQSFPAQPNTCHHIILDSIRQKNLPKAYQYLKEDLGLTTEIL